MDLNNYKYFEAMGADTPEKVIEKLKHVRHVALDMDGTIYKGSTLFPFTISFLNNLKEMGISYSFLTNNPSKSTTDYLKHLEKMGIKADRDEMYTSAQATIDYIRHNHPDVKRIFILGTPSMIKEFEGAGFVSTADSADDRPDMVLVSFDMTLTYSRLCRAAWWIHEGLPYIATNPDKVCPTDQPNILVDCGSIYACLERAAGRNPDVVIGKPSPRMLEGILQSGGLQPHEIAMLGDRIYTDVKMALDAGAVGVLVLTGEATFDDARQADQYPDIVADSLVEFENMLRQAKAI